MLNTTHTNYQRHVCVVGLVQVVNTHTYTNYQRHVCVVGLVQVLNTQTIMKTDLYIKHGMLHTQTAEVLNMTRPLTYIPLLRANPPYTCTDCLTLHVISQLTPKYATLANDNHLQNFHQIKSHQIPLKSISWKINMEQFSTKLPLIF